jgi:hypothetical protein
MLEQTIRDLIARADGKAVRLSGGTTIEYRPATKTFVAWRGASPMTGDEVVTFRRYLGAAGFTASPSKTVPVCEDEVLQNYRYEEHWTIAPKAPDPEPAPTLFDQLEGGSL